MSTMRTLLVLLAAAFTFTACNKPAPGSASGSDSAANDPTSTLPEKYKVQTPVPAPDFTKAAAAPTYQQAIKDATALLGAPPQPLESPGENGRIKGGVSFNVPAKKIEAILRKAHTDFLAKGFYLFRYNQSFGIGDAPDQVGLLPTADKYEVLAAMETDGANYNLTTAGIIAWLKDLEAEQPFILTGVGLDYLEGHFTTPIKDPSGLAKRMYQFCPDIVDQGVGDVDKLATELKKGTLYFWWD